jgi:hypothetical protein
MEFSISRPPKDTKIGNFGMKIYVTSGNPAKNGDRRNRRQTWSISRPKVVQAVLDGDVT